MKESMELLAFAGVMALGQFSPGPDMILLTRTALAEGAKAGAIMAIGWLAAAYLLWLAWCLIRAALRPAAADAPASRRPAPARSPFLRGLICNLLNPKAVLFLAAVCAPFLGDGHPAWWPFAIVAVVIVQGGALWALWARLLQWRPLRWRYERSARWIDGAFGIALAGLAARLLAGS